jgi:hypothetical protein
MDKAYQLTQSSVAKVLCWLSSWHAKKKYPSGGVNTLNPDKVTIFLKQMELSTLVSGHVCITTHTPTSLMLSPHQLFLNIQLLFCVES